MIQLTNALCGLWRQSIVRCADNSGVIKACIIGIGKNKWGTGKIGDRIRVSIRDKTSECGISEKTPKGIIVRRKKETKRKDGSYIKFDDNAFVMISKNKLKATKIKGPVAMETRHNCRNLARYIF
ncbi:mitochondrial ribosomal protein L14 precursor, putative [Plasmodium berghei]|uniref:50S ribosomal protein L14, mitochondrial, putative n=2 Tax=Plasmodium berghei TaxID=5821 RepID=A0A509ANW0_PLABA|nr:50S ribosomal protein L14, mitochondrial, putative [Plasmodium berghei ANKA]CXI81275.1 mitochondrial ribosomal protein L14 precursor, putative [Plasmodium berghei]SCM25491.1 mitochondrial ribosomal protein L14 precursor, putative [Plasmodium berghei]SCN27383.1 mitochondrial ribosomal protein L14 precursor, putative [Plasmodium berghei]SCO62046.1 mitochondrial ribosomal protein L14 precursor, putative [Plasmodium berghei]SCO63809.1 mitochondrial ribosomal protein L14 precursor, putative [Pla|eukprot:XP_034423016.1 50S ribosomal protein L14, mitochondrial, putative [Plasmodium berghei ANKA]